MTDITLDYIVRDLNKEQLWKLAEFQGKVGTIQDLPSFDDAILQDPKYHHRDNELLAGDAEGSPKLQLDMSVINTKAFRNAIGHLTPQTLKAGIWKNVKHDDPDSLVVRHLLARNWNVDVALCMMINSVRWREENNIVDGMLAGGELKIKETADNGTGEDQQIATEIMAQLHSGKSFANGIDKQGRPLLFTRVSLHNPNAQSIKGLEQYSIFRTESARMLLRPPITTAGVIFDLGGFTMANMDWNAIKFLTAGLEDKYPESMGATYVYRAPWIIGGIWSVVKHWLPGTEAQKIVFVKDAKQLSEYVDLKYLPADMGGTGDFKYTYDDPLPGDNDIMKDVEKRDEIMKRRQEIIDEYEKLTWEWVHLCQMEAARDGLIPHHTLDAATLDKAAQSLNAKNAEEAMKNKQKTMARLRENYFELDPYVRGKAQGDKLVSSSS